MIAKIIRGGGFRGVLDYLLSPRELPDGRTERPVVIGGNLDGRDARSLAREFAVARKMRPEVEKPVWHCPLNLPVGEVVSPEKFAAIAADFVAEMGFSSVHPWTVVLHEDKAHQHVHLVVSRIGLDGKLWLGKHDYQKAMDTCRALEKRHGLIPTPSPQKRRRDRDALPLPLTQKELSVPVKTTPTDAAVRARRRAESRGTKVNDPHFLRVTTLDALKLAAAPATLKAFLIAKGIEVAFSRHGAADGAPDADGKIFGWKLRQQGAEEWIGGSSISRELSWPRVAATLEAHAARAVETVAQRPQPANDTDAPAATAPVPERAAEYRVENKADAADEPARISARIGAALARLSPSELAELHAAALQPPPQAARAAAAQAREAKELDAHQRQAQHVAALLRALVDLMLQLLSLGAVRLGPAGAAQAQQHAEADREARELLADRVELEMQRREDHKRASAAAEFLAPAAPAQPSARTAEVAALRQRMEESLAARRKAKLRQAAAEADEQAQALVDAQAEEAEDFEDEQEREQYERPRGG